MFNLLETVANVLAPNPSLLQDFEYHWKFIKTVYSNRNSEMLKIHIADCSLANHFEEMLEILLKEQEQLEAQEECKKLGNCMNFMLENRILDVFVELAAIEVPVGCRQCIFQWFKRYLSCVKEPHLEHSSIYQNCIKLVNICMETQATPYEMDEILFLETVAGLLRKFPVLINLFITGHHHMLNGILEVLPFKQPKANKLFENLTVEPNIEKISLLLDESQNQNQSTSSVDKKYTNSKEVVCDCDENESFFLLDAIVKYIDSADNTTVVRCLEGALILASTTELDDLNCVALKSSMTKFANILCTKLSDFADQIPDDMDFSNIEEAVICWGLFPKDDLQPYFIGCYQLNSFLCWFDYCDILINESPYLADYMSKLVRFSLFESIIEMKLIGTVPSFALVLTSKIIKQIKAKKLLEETATWLVGTDENFVTDCLLFILIENVQDDSGVLLQILQLIEAFLDNPNEKILHATLFQFLNNREYYDKPNSLRNDSGETANATVNSSEPVNILKIINNFLLLLPRPLMNEVVGTCYEEYMHEASHLYQTWVKKTEKFNWPKEALWTDSIQVEDENKQSVDDANLEDFNEGPLLRLLFNQILNMANQSYELNLAVVSIISKLAILPHPYLNEILLSTDIPLTKNARTLWTVLQSLSKKLLSMLPKITNFSEKIRNTANRLLTNPPLLKESEEAKNEDNAEEEQVLESFIVLEEFCKELAAIAFIKFHHSTE